MVDLFISGAWGEKSVNNSTTVVILSQSQQPPHEKYLGAHTRQVGLISFSAVVRTSLAAA